jgi:hypothetical protein
LPASASATTSTCAWPPWGFLDFSTKITFLFFVVEVPAS